MRVKENVTLYYCSHCSKRYEKEYACVKHEHWCSSNPKNFKICGNDCQHLEEVKVEYYDYSDRPVNAKGFYCKAKEINIYPLVVERKGLVEKYPETFEDAEPMPKECKLYKSDYWL